MYKYELHFRSDSVYSLIGIRLVQARHIHCTMIAVIKWCTVFLLVLLYHIQVEALDNGLALTPPMGWMVRRMRCDDAL